jgi:rhodanese-related sulfurtransferase
LARDPPRPDLPMNDFLHKLPEFVGNHPWLSLLFVIILGGLVFNEVTRLLRKYRELTPAMLTQLINRENALVIDLSSYADFEKAHIPGARHVAMSQFDPENKDLAKVRDLPVVVLCKDGRTSAKAAQRLVKAGFQKVSTLGGGMLSWQQAQLPVVKGKA